MKIDFHIHTTASDGQYSPTEIVEMANNLGIDCIAITDHDTLNGVEEAIKAGEKQSVKVIRGIELGAKEHRYMHILGLDLQEKSMKLGELCDTLEKSRNERKYRIINYLAERNIRISLEEVEEIAGGRIIARPHFAQVMVNKGYVSNTREAFDRFLDTEEYQKIERYKASARECIEAIHSAGGKAFLAHPYQLKYTNEELETLVLQLIDIGLDGLECYYPIHSEEQIQFYLQLAEKYQLLISAGSDFHGENVKPNIVLSDRDIDVFWL